MGNSAFPAPPPDASSTKRGLVNLVAQTFAGAKTWLALAIFVLGARFDAAISSTVASGADAFGVTTVGARIRLGAFAGTYLAGLDFGPGYIVVGGGLSVAGGPLSLRNDVAGANLSVGTSGTERASVDCATGNIATFGTLTFNRFLDDSANPGPRTVDQVRGKSAFAAGTSSVVITNSYVTAASQVICTLEAVDGTLTQILTCIPAAGFFTVRGNANATAATKFSWTVIK